MDGLAIHAHNLKLTVIIIWKPTLIVVKVWSYNSYNSTVTLSGRSYSFSLMMAYEWVFLIVYFQLNDPLFSATKPYSVRFFWNSSGKWSKINSSNKTWHYAYILCIIGISLNIIPHHSFNKLWHYDNNGNFSVNMRMMLTKKSDIIVHNFKI